MRREQAAAVARASRARASATVIVPRLAALAKLQQLAAEEPVVALDGGEEDLGLMGAFELGEETRGAVEGKEEGVAVRRRVEEGQGREELPKGLVPGPLGLEEPRAGEARLPLEPPIAGELAEFDGPPQILLSPRELTNISQVACFEAQEARPQPAGFGREPEDLLHLPEGPGRALIVLEHKRFGSGARGQCCRQCEADEDAGPTALEAHGDPSGAAAVLRPVDPGCVPAACLRALWRRGGACLRPASVLAGLVEDVATEYPPAPRSVGVRCADAG